MRAPPRKTRGQSELVGGHDLTRAPMRRENRAQTITFRAFGGRMGIEINPCLALFYIYKRRRPFLTYVNLHHRPKPPAPSLPIAGAIVQTSIPKVQPAFSSQTRPSPHRSAQQRNKKSPREPVIAHDTTPQDRRSPLFTTLSIDSDSPPGG